MSEESENTPSPRTAPTETAQPRIALRGDWTGWSRWTPEKQAEIDIRECSDASCMNVTVNVGYQGLDADSPLSQEAAVGDELRAAWRSKLAGEGKTTAGKSLREIIFGASDKDAAGK